MKTVKVTSEFDKWEKALRDRKAVAKIRVRIERLAEGNPGDHRNLAGGVTELKIDFGPGYRVYLTERKGEIIILLCGGTKKGQNADIKLAQKMAKEV